MNSNKVIFKLRELIKTCQTAQTGFSGAAESVNTFELKTLFQHCSKQCSDFAAELQAEVHGLTRNHAKPGSRAESPDLIDFESTLTGQDEGAIISECERLENSVRKNYEEALSSDLGQSATCEIVERQYRQIKEAQSRLRALKTLRNLFNGIAWGVFSPAQLD